ncbi:MULTISPECIES: LysR family transcriptional regulator [Pseudoalteromonas]|uniref:LysR family transcriptional regulator n=1 Tax=Pseudoalteromonas fuliginea TaxID=1872678 RepID=A0ABD3YB31_9GAMM|nr:MULTISPECIES: LysR family transcriptional regulator [Pseudoalteromonas]KDC51869.1 LysR family transcriptional regulator [Pseudoalteromonas fuliginea]KJZ27610.1 LysR family transcriptional regulator [Pseudoalteromonas fuliginea]MBQ4857036.1 LysR family transcriptional regulator [Pseudoalteromonas sp. MMG007]
MFHPRDLTTFCKVAEIGNMSRVAEAEAKTVMAISKQIARLETQLNQALFVRSRRKLILTEFGSAFKHKAAQLLQQHQELVLWSHNSDSMINGELRVICQANDIIKETLVPWMAEFTALYPELNITMDVKESLININESEFDVFWAVSSYLGERYPGLKRKPLWRSKYGVFASPEYIQRQGDPTDIKALEHHNVVGYLYNQPSNVLVLQSENGEPIYVTPHCQVKTVSGIVELAEAGLGLINAPVDSSQIQKSLNEGRLVPILKKHWWEDAQVYAYYHPSNPIQSKVRAFLDFFCDKRDYW